MPSSSSAPRGDFRARTNPKQQDDPPSRSYRFGREAASLVLVAGAIFLTLGLASFSRDPAVPEIDGPNWVGPVGAFFADSIVSLIGVAAWTIPVELILISLPLFRNKPGIGSLARIGGDSILILITAALVHVSFPKSTAFGAMPAGGSFGELFGELMRSLFSDLGSYLIGFTIIALVLIARASFSFINFAQR
ncbi:MAG: DNA translocase FtsK 4TM domain-containing protein, partial [Polyangiaceae bacterium]|nr:DNA translocase FtsK 4TM domain-containing protein [Polyangiaceae bacterium]